MIALALVAMLAVQDTLLVSVELVETRERVVVEAVLTADSVLHLPSAPVHQLLGLGAPTAAWLTIAELQAAWPSVRIVWSPRELRVVILDDLRVLPASHYARQQVLARTQMTLGLTMQSAPYFSLAWDDRSALLDAGYAWRGRVSVGGRVDNLGAAAWHASIAPVSNIFVSYQGGVGIRPAVQGRVAAGPLWLAGGYTSGGPVNVAGSLRAGRVQLFASPDFGVITLQPDPRVSVQLARTWETKRTAARISVGPAYASPFAFPTTSLTSRR